MIKLSENLGKENTNFTVGVGSLEEFGAVEPGDLIRLGSEIMGVEAWLSDGIEAPAAFGHMFTLVAHRGLFNSPVHFHERGAPVDVLGAPDGNFPELFGKYGPIEAEFSVDDWPPF